MGRQPMFILLSVLVAIILLSDSVGCSRPAEPPFYGDAGICARILKIKDAETAGRIAIAEIDSLNGEAVSPFKARLHFLGEYPYLTVGDVVWTSTRLRAMPPVPDIPDAIDLQTSLRRDGVVASAVVVMDSISAIGRVGTLSAYFQRLNDKAMTRLMKTPLSGETIDMLAAMLLGRADMLMPSTRDLYSASGLSHLLALSGMHVSIIALIIGIALFPLYLTAHVRSRMLLTAIALWIYACFTGLAPSVTRSVIMATLFIGARCIQRRSSPLNSLFTAAFLILLFRPSDLYSVGFQMSFSAVLGIILYFPLINRVDRRNHPRLFALASYPALSVSAMIFTGLVAAYHFHTFPLYFIIANLLAAPLIPLFLVSGIFSMTFNVCGPTDFLGSALHFVAQLTAELPGAVIDSVYPQAWAVMLLIALLALFAYAFGNGNRFRAMLAAIAATAVVIIAFVQPPKAYPAYEEYLVVEPRSTQLVVRNGNNCTLFTTIANPFERADLQQRYSLILRDFLAKRSIDTLMLSDTDTIPAPASTRKGK